MSKQDPRGRRSLSSLIRSARSQAGLTQAELAQRLGTSQPAVSRWESGRDEPRLSTLRAALDSCGFVLDLIVRPQGDVDRAQIRQQLAMTPEQRLASVINVSRTAALARRA